ncbi:MAG: hypothetical protein LBP63_09175 [Prevotellaceae bacterium]|jgi:hypothetical protein|nr:hypothetical protein [Prevotellaceae bacterium]
MKKIILTVLTVLAAGSAFCQSKSKYAELVNKADKLYADKEYFKSANELSEAFAKYGVYAQTIDRYRAARAWALAGQADSAFVQLFQITHIEEFADLNLITNDASLSSLHADERWNFIIEFVKQNREKADKLDAALAAQLDSIYREDRQHSFEINEIEQNYGRNSNEMRQYLKKLSQKNSENIIKITKILDEKGWLGPDIIGEHGSRVLFSVMQYADTKTQEKYLPMIEDAVANEKADPIYFALLKDEMALKQGKRQIYGSRIGIDVQTGKYYIVPLEDPDNIDKRRAEIGLSKYNDYLSIFGLTWNVDEYKKELPELEAKHGIK